MRDKVILGGDKTLNDHLLLNRVGMLGGGFHEIISNGLDKQVLFVIDKGTCATLKKRARIVVICLSPHYFST